MFPVPTFETQDTFDFMKVFPTFEAGLKELCLVSYSAANSVRAYADDYQKSENTWADEVRSAFAAAAEQGKWQSLLDQYGEDDSPLPAFVQEKTLVYSTTGGFTYGWRERADGTFEFGVKHPNSAQQAGCPADSSLRYSAWLHQWQEITVGGYSKLIATPTRAIERVSERERQMWRKPDRKTFVSDWYKATDKVAFLKKWQEQWSEYLVSTLIQEIVDEDPDAFTRGYFLDKGEQAIRTFLTNALWDSQVTLTDEELRELVENNRYFSKVKLEVVRKGPASQTFSDEEEDDSAYLGKSTLRKLREGALLLDEDDE